FFINFAAKPLITSGLKTNSIASQTHGKIISAFQSKSIVMTGVESKRFAVSIGMLVKNAIVNTKRYCSFLLNGKLVCIIKLLKKKKKSPAFADDFLCTLLLNYDYYYTTQFSKSQTKKALSGQFFIIYYQ
ncbi:MAG: hypothetical protein J6K71_02560, partial [Clostridia bacterium]|nr:hypothetical protein [Clostridia bacterium]